MDRKKPVDHSLNNISHSNVLDDNVYMDDEAQLKEYVLNDRGKVWLGTYKTPLSYQWFFGQFKPVILPTIMILLDRSSITDEDRADPVKMARCISAVVSIRTFYVCVCNLNVKINNTAYFHPQTNNNDENGLIVGNWNPPFKHGTSPLAWAGSPPIFEEFYKTQKPVKFGQCWVFSGVIVTSK